MTREHAWSQRGARAPGRVPRNRGKVLTVIGALTYDGLEAVMAVEGGTTAGVFREFVDGHLVPILQPADVVVMDNLGAHHATGIREAIEATGARVLFMPPYSPDLNAIELCWSKFKGVLRRIGARTVVTLRQAVRRATAQIRQEDAVAWIDFVAGQVK
jgi:transposase